MCYICTKKIPLNMKKFIFGYLVVATLLIIIGIAYIRYAVEEIHRLRNNTESLTSEVRLYKTRYNTSAASVIALQLEMEELRQNHKRELKRVKSLRIRPRNVESIATSATESEVEFSTPLRNGFVAHEPLLADTTKHAFGWSDKWTRVEGTLRGDIIDCKVESVDTIHQVVHRVPRRFLFFKYGTKAIRQEITSSNPHTRIVYTEYIELPKRRKRR